MRERHTNGMLLSAAVVCLLASGLALTACAGSSAPADTRRGAQFVGEGEYQARYREVVKSFPEKMPHGMAFPSAAPSLGGAQTQLSGGDAQAYFYWNCAWEKTYLEATTPEARSDAMRELRRFPHTSWAKEWTEDPEHGWDKLLDAVELGDTSGLARSFTTECSGYGLSLASPRRLTPSPSTTSGGSH